MPVPVPVVFAYLVCALVWVTTTTLVFIQPLIALLVDYHREAEAHLSAHSYLGAVLTMGVVFLSLLPKHSLRAKT